jgi:hypothetical protein
VVVVTTAFVTLTPPRVVGRIPFTIELPQSRTDGNNGDRLAP